MELKTVINAAALIILVVATAFGLFWVWGVLFLFWAVQGYRLGTVFLIGSISRAETPLLYWMVLAFWVVLACWYFLPAQFW